MDRIDEIASHFQSSLVSTAVRSVRLSDFPCALAGVREGTISWMFASEGLVRAGIYPRRGDLPANADQPWYDMASNVAERVEMEGQVGDWFETYGREGRDELWLQEEYFPVPVTDTLMVLLTLDESDIADDDD
jgi:hypothetical protein